ncbi:uncharacterized protein LOC130984912 [Salvia miltiorrhiza]|uniref:uncharacterized protein LOC130984912 n=1 Tax=Salvia miltiorrhiza TaxID=226208 RepID=UPI0025AD8BA4|nr:uncharacterized protein LOC130984912 [Salvia miltiorrhiza]
MKMFEIQIGQIGTAISNLHQSGKFPSNTKVNPNEQCMAIGLKSAATSEGNHGSREMGDESKQNHEGSRRVPPPYHPPWYPMSFPQRHYKIVDLPSGTTQEWPKMPEDESAPPVVEEKDEEVTVERHQKERMKERLSKFLEIFKKVNINIPLVEMSQEMLQYAKFLKDIVSRKKKLGEFETEKLNEECSAILQRKLPAKIKDPGSFTISCIIGGQHFGRSLCDLGASINLMSLSVFQQLAIGELKPTSMRLQMADSSVTYPRGIVEDVLVKVGDFIFLADFVVLDIEDDNKILMILRHPFLAMGRALIDVEKGELTLRVHDESQMFFVYKPCRIYKDEVPKKAKDPGKVIRILREKAWLTRLEQSAAGCSIACTSLLEESAVLSS